MRGMTRSRVDWLVQASLFATVFSYTDKVLSSLVQKIFLGYHSCAQYRAKICSLCDDN